MDGTDLAQDRDMWQAVANMVKLGFDKVWRVCWLAKGTISFTRRTLLHAVSQSVSWLPIIRYLVCSPCIY